MLVVCDGGFTPAANLNPELDRDLAASASVVAVVAGASGFLVLKENVDDVRGGAVVDCVIDGELDVSFFSLLSVVPIPPKLNAGFDVLLLLALGNENGVEGLSVDGVAKLNFLVAGSSVFLSSASVLALLVIPNLKGVEVVVVVAVVLEAASLFDSPLDPSLLSVVLAGAPKVNPVLGGLVVEASLSSSFESPAALSSFCPNVNGVVEPLLELSLNNEVVSVGLVSSLVVSVFPKVKGVLEGVVSFFSPPPNENGVVVALLNPKENDGLDVVEDSVLSEALKASPNRLGLELGVASFSAESGVLPKLKVGLFEEASAPKVNFGLSDLVSDSVEGLPNKGFLVVAVSFSSLDFGLVILNNEVVVELFSLLPKSEGVAGFEVFADPNRKEGTGGLSSLSESDKFLFFLGASCEGTGLEPNKPGLALWFRSVLFTFSGTVSLANLDFANISWFCFRSLIILSKSFFLISNLNPEDGPVVGLFGLELSKVVGSFSFIISDIELELVFSKYSGSNVNLALLETPKVSRSRPVLLPKVLKLGSSSSRGIICVIDLSCVFG